MVSGSLRKFLALSLPLAAHELLFTCSNGFINFSPDYTTILLTIIWRLSVIFKKSFVVVVFLLFCLSPCAEKYLN